MPKDKKIFFYLSLIILLLSFSLTIFNRVYSFKRAGAQYDDFLSHFYDMKQYYESKTIPVTGARLVMRALGDESAPRVPGGFFYIHYLLTYKLANENITVMRIINLITMLFPVLIFLFWVYKRFGISILAIMSVFTLFNIFYVYTNTIYYNPNLTLVLSFLLIPIIAEYMANTKYSNIAAMMFFPVLALMGQSHFAVYYGIVPTVILYLIVRYKITIKYIKYILLGVFISFLTYLPYLISEIQNGFQNTNKMFMLSSTTERTVFPFPQVHFLFMFPTNEFSIMYYAKHFDRIMAFYLNDNPYYIFCLIVLVLSIIVVFGAFIYSIIIFIKNKKWKIDNNTNNTEMVINELFILFLLYFPATIFTTIFAHGVAGLARYQFGGFGLSFVPIIYFLYYLMIKNNYRVLNYMAVFSILSAVAMNFNIIVFYQKIHEPYRWTDYIESVYAITEDANGMNFKVANASGYFNDMGRAYSKNDSWKNVSTNESITYYLDVPEFEKKYPPLYDRNALLSKKYTKEEIENMNLKVISSNSTCIVYRK